MANPDHQRFMDEAVRLAEQNVRDGGGPFGAVVVKDGTVIARGGNRVTSEADPTAHAEVVAIRRACEALEDFVLEGCTLYASCEPCPMCLGAIYWARLEAVYYAATQADAAAAGFDDRFIYDEIAKPPETRTLRMKRLGKDDGARPFEAWSTHEARVEY